MPGPGMPPPPPPRPRSSNAPIIIAVAGGGFIILVVVVLVLALTVFKGEKDRSPTDQLATASSALTSSRAVSLRGSFSSGSDTLQGELKVSKGGRATGQVSWNGDNVSLLSADEKLYVRADASYWRRQSPFTDSPHWLQSGARWGRIQSYELSVDFKDELTPAALAQEMRGIGKYSIRSTSKSSVQGNAAVKIVTYRGSFYVSDDEEARLLRIETTSPTVNADVISHSSDDQAAITDIRNRIGELKGSIDATKNPRADKPAFGRCDPPAPCSVRTKVWSTRGSDSSVEVAVLFRLTSGRNSGRLFGECTDSGTVTSFTSVPVSCLISGGEWARSGPKHKSWWVRAEAYALGASTTDIQSLQRALDSE